MLIYIENGESYCKKAPCVFYRGWYSSSNGINGMLYSVTLIFNFKVKHFLVTHLLYKLHKHRMSPADLPRLARPPPWRCSCFCSMDSVAQNPCNALLSRWTMTSRNTVVVTEDKRWCWAVVACTHYHGDIANRQRDTPYRVLYMYIRHIMLSYARAIFAQIIAQILAQKISAILSCVFFSSRRFSQRFVGLLTNVTSREPAH